jgi:hypothetical protein
MPDITPNVPGGVMPPKPAEAAKVQPKKETVRINLPPKPTSAPTIKLPTLAPGAPMPTSTSAAAPTAAAPRAAAPPAQPTAPAAPASRAGAPATAVSASAKVPAAAPTQRPQVYVPAVQGIRKLDKGLAIAAAVMALAAIGTTLYLIYGIDGITRN